MMSELCAAKGSSTAVEQSGISTMSLSLIAFQPAIEEPSNMTPPERKSSLIVRIWCARCCHLPRGSVKRKSTYLHSCSLIISSTLSVSAIFPFPVVAGFQQGRSPAARRYRASSDRVRAALAGADADRFLDVRNKDLAVADAAGMRGLLDRLDRPFDHRFFHHHFDLHLGQEVDDVFGP